MSFWCIVCLFRYFVSHWLFFTLTSSFYLKKIALQDAFFLHLYIKSIFCRFLCVLFRPRELWRYRNTEGIFFVMFLYFFHIDFLFFFLHKTILLFDQVYFLVHFVTENKNMFSRCESIESKIEEKMRSFIICNV